MLAKRSRRTLSLCSPLAIAASLVAGPQAAQAQSFQGSSTVVSGSATVTTGANTTTVNVASPQAVINWTPTDTAISAGTPINFQPAGTTATFQSASDFAVLNRILPADASRPVAFNGTVISQIQGTLTQPGGTVYFYSPGGIIVGSSAVFNVGNLGLTALDPLVDGNGNWYNGNQVQFQQGSPGAMVNIQPGAQINAHAGELVRRAGRALGPEQRRRDHRQRVGRAGRGRSGDHHLQPRRPVRHPGDGRHERGNVPGHLGQHRARQFGIDHRPRWNGG